MPGVYHQTDTRCVLSDKLLETIFAVWISTPKRFVWRAREIGKAADLVAATVATIMLDMPLVSSQPVYSENNSNGYVYKVRFSNTREEGYLPFIETLGCFFFTTNASSPIDDAFFFLYIGKDRILRPGQRPVSLYQHFQKVYTGIAGADSGTEEGFQYVSWFGFCFEACKPAQFTSLARRSINRRRQVDLRTRARILNRDHSACQVCGQRAPDVKLVVDHRIPVSIGERSDNSDANLWTLCEECNLGKSNLPFFID